MLKRPPISQIRSFFTIWQHLLATPTWIFEKVAPEGRGERGERGEEKRTAGTHNFYIAYFGDSF